MNPCLCIRPDQLAALEAHERDLIERARLLGDSKSLACHTSELERLQRSQPERQYEEAA